MNNKELYESIIKSVSKEVKRALNEAANPQDIFVDKSEAKYEWWISDKSPAANIAKQAAEKINIKKYPTFDDLHEDIWELYAFEYYLDLFNEALYTAVKGLAKGDSWYKVGLNLGMTEQELDELFDSFEAKYEPFLDACEALYTKKEAHDLTKEEIIAQGRPVLPYSFETEQEEIWYKIGLYDGATAK